MIINPFDSEAAWRQNTCKFRYLRVERVNNHIIFTILQFSVLRESKMKSHINFHYYFRNGSANPVRPAVSPPPHPAAPLSTVATHQASAPPAATARPEEAPMPDRPRALANLRALWRLTDVLLETRKRLLRNWSTRIVMERPLFLWRMGATGVVRRIVQLQLR